MLRFLMKIFRRSSKKGSKKKIKDKTQNNNLISRKRRGNILKRKVIVSNDLYEPYLPITDEKQNSNVTSQSTYDDVIFNEPTYDDVQIYDEINSDAIYEVAYFGKFRRRSASAGEISRDITEEMYNHLLNLNEKRKNDLYDTLQRDNDVPENMLRKRSLRNNNSTYYLLSRSTSHAMNETLLDSELRRIRRTNDFNKLMALYNQEKTERTPRRDRKPGGHLEIVKPSISVKEAVNRFKNVSNSEGTKKLTSEELRNRRIAKRSTPRLEVVSEKDKSDSYKKISDTSTPNIVVTREEKKEELYAKPDKSFKNAGKTDNFPVIKVTTPVTKLTQKDESKLKTKYVPKGKQLSSVKSFNNGTNVKALSAQFNENSVSQSKSFSHKSTLNNNDESPSCAQDVTKERKKVRFAGEKKNELSESFLFNTMKTRLNSVR
ncbi:uncharacterized protein LOC120342236 [Styela clava]